MAAVIDTVNYKDVLSVLIKKYFTNSIESASIFDWLSEIATEQRRRGDCQGGMAPQALSHPAIEIPKRETENI